MAKRRSWWSNAALRQAIALNEGVGYHAAALSFFARLPAAPTPARKAVISDTFRALESYGLLAKIKGLCMPFSLGDPGGSTTGNDRAASLVDWINPLTPLTEIDGGNLTFTADLAWQGNGSSSKLSWLNPSTGIDAEYDNTGFFGILSMSSGQSVGAGNPVDAGNDNTLIRCRSNINDGVGNVMSGRVGAASSSGTVVNVVDATGWFITYRTTSAAADNRNTRAGVLLPANTNPSGAQVRSNNTIHICGRGGASPSFSSRPIGGCVIGYGFTATDIENFNTVMG